VRPFKKEREGRRGIDSALKSTGLEKKALFKL
jgi:hypothetical protein